MAIDSGMTFSDEHAGTTPSERLLFSLCRTSFLQLWSYANVYRDQGQQEHGEGKELCDVLVVFENSIILFSDKSISFPTGTDALVSWRRWYRRAVEGSHRQLTGASRWIRKFPDRVFLDRRCTRGLHVPLPPTDKMRIYKVAVALGASSRCRALDPTRSGSLSLVKYARDDRIDPDTVPFVVPLCDKNGDVIHIVDDVTLPIILKDLDTIADFTEYLESKEKLIANRERVLVHGEEDLVGLFLGVRSGLPEMAKQFDSIGGGSIEVQSGIYSALRSLPSYYNYIKENASSYFWDGLIANHTTATLNGLLVDGSDTTISENERLLRILASESRVSRRLLANAFIDLIRTSPREEIRSRVVDGNDNKLYVFQVHPQASRDYATYRRERQTYLINYCFLTGFRNQHKRQVVGIVTDGLQSDDGFDVFAADFDEWTPGMIADSMEIERELSTFVTMPMTMKHMPGKHLSAWGMTQRQQCGQADSPSQQRFKMRKKERERKIKGKRRRH